MPSEYRSLKTRVARAHDTSDKTAGRTRPTNNQLLYKAYFRWNHYRVPESRLNDVEETEACASVTAAFLQVMSILHEVEELHCRTEKRNILKLLSQDTRHTKIVDLVCGTHKVSEELKKHSLTDSEGTQYTTNLDRNRYQTDNQYMVTVIRHNLSVLGLCPCLVDVEIIDQKSTNTKLISAGNQHCICRGSNLGESRSWRKAEQYKMMSCEGRSCSAGSSSLTGDAPWDSPSTNPTSTQKHNLPKKKRKERRSSLVHNRGFDHKRASFKRHGLIEEDRTRWKESPSTLEKDLQSFASLDCDMTNINDRFDRDYIKRNRDSGSVEGTDWEHTNNHCGYATAPMKFQNQNKTTSSSGIEPETKRFKSYPQQLDEALGKLLVIVLDQKSRLESIDLMHYSVEEQCLLDQIENEKDLFKTEVNRVVDICRKGESKMDSYRSLISQLFDSIRQEEEAKMKLRQDDDHSIRQPIKFQSNETNKHLSDPITQCFSNTSASLVPNFQDILVSSNSNQDRKTVFFKQASNSNKKLDSIGHSWLSELGLSSTDPKFDHGCESMLSLGGGPLGFPSGA